MINKPLISKPTISESTTIVPKKGVAEDILSDSVLVHIAAAYFSVGKRLERKTQCSATRRFILSTLRGDARLNQNQIATLLGLDRTVVHRAIKAMVQEGLVSERKASNRWGQELSPNHPSLRSQLRITHRP